MTGKVIVVATEKGGDGKSTVMLILSEFFAEIKNKKTLDIDKDPQGNSSKKHVEMLIDPFADNIGGKMPLPHPEYNEICSTASLYADEDIFPYPTKLDNLYFLPAYGSQLQEIDSVEKDGLASKVYDKFVEKIELLKESFEYIFIDTRPSKGPLTTAAIRAADYILIPSQMEQFSIDGIYGMLQMVKTENYRRDKDNQLKLIGILPNHVRDTRLHSAFLEQLKETPGIKEYVIPYPLKKRTIYAEIMVDSHEPAFIHELKPSDPARKEAEQFCEYVYDIVENENNG